MTMALVEQETDMMEQLPLDVMVRILDYMDIPTRLKLARCSLTLQRRVYRDCSQAWVSIRFWELRSPYLKCLLRFTDYHLSRLLVRVNARDVTKNLNLMGCCCIRGSGLTPLRNSRVLERVNLYDTGADENPTPIVSILQSMVPFKLVDVILSDECMERSRDVLASFFHSLRRTQLEQAQEIDCTCCKLPIMEEEDSLFPIASVFRRLAVISVNRAFADEAAAPWV